MSWDGHMSGSDWFWMSLSMGVWVIVVGVVVYAAVRLATGDRNRR